VRGLVPSSDLLFPKHVTTWLFKIVSVKKVKYTLVQALRLCTGRTAHKESRGIALIFHDHGTRRGRGVSVTPRPFFYPRERAGTHCTGGWVGPRDGLDRCKKFLPIRIRSPDRPARNQSLYRLRYPAHKIVNKPGLSTLYLKTPDNVKLLNIIIQQEVFCKN